MEKSTKIGLWIGGLLLAGGIGVGIYASTRKKVVDKTNTGSGPDTGSTTKNKPDSKAMEVINKIVNAANLIKTYTTEQFPLKPGMKGPKVKSLQMALRVNFNQLSVANDGFFGAKTAIALRNIGYTDALLNGVSLEDFNNILDGKSPY